MIWFLADTHFGHYLSALGRPFQDERMDQLIIDGWNLRVKSGDIVWHLGDFALGMKFEDMRSLFRKLNGDKHLVKGNHCQNNKVHRLGWASIHDTHMLSTDKGMIWLSHYSHQTWPQKGHGSFHLFGHSHGNLTGIGRSMDVGIDCHNYEPISLDYVIHTLTPLEYKIQD